MRQRSLFRAAGGARPAAAALVLAAGLASGLAGCGPDTARTLGFTRDAPDEFAVTTRAPLSMPPDMTVLPPPRPGAGRPQEASVREQAEAALLGGAALGGPAAPARPTTGELALVSQAGPGAPPDIRRRVDEESLRLEQPERSFVDRLMFWRAPPAPGTPVDPQREAQRLRENAALGRAPTEGETPIIQPRRRGLLEGLF
ncbi:hypothetical protein GCM10010964_23590 [Caldovatus sediminis]|uniref:DUF3035 domain-containing protein n=1 Tax=Caldovatus sediminis TaxID=2041189 RepID=A0A8J2ZBX2_9PROT|nr:DUF3035 domain-containing protein [Caldovatus sediminis]GGG34984.1 hypothetical protein GCM10010964_23590 [Caldovatus sediminis]